MNIESLARPEIVAMKPYSSARKEAPGKGILLNANEAPWPLIDPGDGAETGLNRYPDPQPEKLLARLAGLYGVQQDHLLVTRGSDEGIDLLTRVFCRAGQDAILHCPPTFGMYRIAAQTQGAGIVSVSRTGNDFALDEQRVLDTVAGDDRVRLVFLTSPNNPTGDIPHDGFVQSLLDATEGRALVVIDEAYAEFTKQPSATALVPDYEHLVVLRTMSKAWASAGLRCGSVIAQQSVIGLLRRVIAPYPLPSPVVDLALRMLQDDMLEAQGRMLERISENKRTLLGMLKNRTFIRQLIPGEANFVLLRMERADELLMFCAERNLVLRGFPADPALRDCVRITVGSKEDLVRLADTLDEWESMT
jgi:histidinol-phosphate aminotransferase